MCAREIDGEAFEFGTTGYTMNNVFTLYDRKTESVWYPLTEESFDAVSGPAKGASLEFIVKPEVLRLHEWVKQHPDTLVLLPPDSMVRGPKPGRRLTDAIVGDWNMHTDLSGQMIDAVMTLSTEGGRLAGVWKSMDREMELRELRYNGRDLSFAREISPDQVLTFRGRLEDGKITGTYSGPFGELECTGVKVDAKKGD